MTSSMLPAIFVVQIAYVLALGARASRRGLLAMAIVSVALFGWALLTAWFARSGVYDAQGFLALLPGIWLPAVPFVLVAVLLVVPSVRGGLKDIATTTPARWLVAIHGLRILAVGTLVKTVQGTFPLEVELAIGLTDLAYGLSALWVFALARSKRISADALVLWHLVGIALILVPGLPSLQAGLPGPFQAFDRFPTSAVMLDWPMVLGPTLVVPLFLLLNLLGALAARRSATQPQGRTP